jgi:predicted transcriptional regulator of viral defense system
MTQEANAATVRDMDVGTTAEWAKAGISSERLRTLTRRGELVRLRRGIYATAGAVAATAGDKARRHALEVRAILALAHGTVASHESATLVHGLPLLHEPTAGTVSLTRPAGRYRGSSEAGVRYHVAQVRREHVTTVHGALVMTAGRTTIDLARTLPFMDAVVVADAAIRLRKTRKTELSSVIAECKRWPGADQARRVVAFSSGRSGSVLESCARVVFDAFGLPPPELQAKIIGGMRVDSRGNLIALDEYHDYKVDFLWRDLKAVAETDGLMKYDSGQAAIRQLQRDRLIREAGYQVVHITWKELFERPERVIERILTAFAAASPY